MCVCVCVCAHTCCAALCGAVWCNVDSFVCVGGRVDGRVVQGVACCVLAWEGGLIMVVAVLALFGGVYNVARCSAVWFSIVWHVVCVFVCVCVSVSE